MLILYYLLYDFVVKNAPLSSGNGPNSRATNLFHYDFFQTSKGYTDTMHFTLDREKQSLSYVQDKQSYIQIQGKTAP